MNTLLIAGLDSVVGIHLAAHFSERCQVVGVSFNDPISPAGFHAGHCYSQEENDVQEWVESIRPDRLVYCGPSANSAWDPTVLNAANAESVDAAGRWAKAANEYGAKFTLVSTDALFTGPWIFHTEDSNCFCDSKPARAAQRTEKICARNCPDSLIVRTNVYGWSYTENWIEQTIAALDLGVAGPFDFQAHATPIEAESFCEILDAAWQAELDGLYHIAGAERINPNQFVHRLAEEFDLSAPQPVNGNRLLERPTGFGRGETSLHTTRIRKALEIGMPTIADGLRNLRQQKLDGKLETLPAPAVLENAA